jgi:glycosyltransferase involved in cell wall biosynthesis
MRVLFWCGDYYPHVGGAASVSDDLARALVRRGHEVTLLSRLGPGLPSSETRNGYSIVRFDFPVLFDKLILNRHSILRSPGVFMRAWKLLRGFDTVCIGLLDISAFYLLLLRPCFRFRLVLYLHGSDTRKLPREERSYRAVLKLALWAAHAVIPVSGGLAREAAAYLPSAAGKMHVIPNGIDVQGGKHVEPWQHPREYIAFAGRLVPEKDVGTLVEAFKIAAPRIPHVDLVICGPGHERAELVARARAGGTGCRIRFLGPLGRRDALAVMKGALLLVLPSRSEGHPLVVLEALAAGKPVIGSSIPAIAALVTDGVNGALFPAGDPAALARLLEKYCGDRSALDLITAGACQTDCSRFAMDSLVARHLEVYREPHGMESVHCDAAAEAE